MVDVVAITGEQAERLLQLTESHFLDLKARDVKPAKMSRTLAAFCNADGGDLYIGADEMTPGAFSWRGFDDPEDANGIIQAFESVSPFGEDLDGEFLRCDDMPGLVLHVNARKSRQIRTSTDGKVYKRLGAQNLPVVSEAAVTSLRRLKGIDSFETETLPIDLTEVTNSEVVIRYLLEVVPSAEPEIYLRKQQFIVSDRPTVAATLLFSDEPQIALPKRSGIKIYRYTSEMESRDQLVGDPQTIEGPIYNQIYDAVAATVETIEKASFLDESGLRTVRYPTETLHEIITNAVLHRDYSITDDVHVRIFENRIEVTSPGRLPGHITPKNILRERASRNPALVRHVNRFPDPPNKDVGEGLNTAFEFMKKLNLRDPVIEELDHSVRVTIRHESLASPAKQVVDFLSENPRIRNQEARKVTAIDSESKMKKIFEQLIQDGEIEHEPGTSGRGYAYRLAGRRT